MKRVPMLHEEPEALARWRAENPADDASTGPAVKGAWERLKSSGVYGPLVEQLRDRQQGLCGYCEQRVCKDDGTLVVNDYQVEHVLAKSGGSRRVLAWRNLMLCCGGGTCKHLEEPARYRPSSRRQKNVSCGQAKGDLDLHVPCDPRSLPWREPVVRVDIDGRLRPNEDACRRLGIDPEALRRVIDDELALNCERLRVARESAIDNLEREQKVLFEWLFAASHLPPDRLRVAFQLFVEGRLRPSPRGYLRPFWTTERVYLGDEAEGWIRDNASLLHFAE